MRYPTSLAVTKNDDILVADARNDRILSMNSSLSSGQQLTLPACEVIRLPHGLPVRVGIQQPHGLCLDESRGRLYVGEGGGSCRVFVFDGVTL